MTPIDYRYLFVKLIPGLQHILGSCYKRFSFFLNISDKELTVDGVGFDRTRSFDLSDPELQMKTNRYLDVVIDPSDPEITKKIEAYTGSYKFSQ